ncbi:MAG TPA: sigma-70 family RNA polymerase sigma factor [Thermoleophilaceae bacterium]|nr:sigma-70 family RNA polymerase sigma factor [Thermoleophilaceae bacterium]
MDDARVIAALRTGDEAAFAELVDRLHPSLVRVARLYVSSQAVAEEVAQETWLGVLNGLDRFEERSSLKTWIFRILANIAKTRGTREGRTVPFSSVAGEEEGHAVDPDRFIPPEAERAPRHWAIPPCVWSTEPDERLLAGEVRELIFRTIETLPPNQRAAIVLRDVEGWSSEDVRNELGVGDTNQRVLLHRARSRVRQALEDYFRDEDS